MPTTRHIKIFISSTFQDMDEEREILLKNTFLELKKIAKERFVEVTEIDLRTGVTSQQAQSGQVVKICLDEIERCSTSPIFFLGMLGNRYGSVDWIGGVDKNILEDERYSWIKEHTDVSITEIEIISALERDAKHNRAFFYLKEGEDDSKKLTNLKNRLESKRGKNLSIDYYRDENDFKKQTIDSLTKALDELYPKDEKPSEVEKLRATRQIFAQSRQKVYISHPKNESILSEFIEGDEDRLLLYGESGYGKSALIVNYFEKFKQNSDSFVIEHYIGGAGELSNDLHQMLRRVMLEIKEEFELEDEVPSEPQKIMNEFAIWLHRVKRETIIVFDGYNQIEDELKEKLFYYIPEKLENIKLIISSIKNSYPIKNQWQIEALTKEEQRELVVDYLKGYGKTVDEPTQNRIIDHPQTDNTLFLRTLLNEIRLLGTFERLQKDIEEYLRAKDVVELFIKIFERLEDDYREHLAKEVLSLLYVSRDGLSEDNLMEIINQNTAKKLTLLEFSPLFLALEEHLIDRGGLYGFFHDYIREAVENRYLSDNELINGERRKIADYFEDREIDNQRVRELPYQLFKVMNRERLYKTLIDVEFFVTISKENNYELLKYVWFIDKDFNISKKLVKILLVNTYMDEYIINKIAGFFHIFYVKYKESLVLYKKLLKINNGVNHKKIDIIYNNLAVLYQSMGIYDKAYYFYKKSMMLSEQVSGRESYRTARSYLNLAGFYKIIGKYVESESLYKDGLEIFEKVFGENYEEVAICYNNLAGLYYIINDYKKVEFLYKKSFKINNKLFGKKHKNTMMSINNLGAFYLRIENYIFANILLEEALEISQILLGEEHPDTAEIYNNLGRLYEAIESFEKAKYFLHKALMVRKKNLGEVHLSTAQSYNNLSVFYYNIEEFEDAYFYLKKALPIYESQLIENHPHLLNIKDGLKMIKKN